MTNHDAMHKLAQAWKAIQAATQLTNCPRVIDNLALAEKHIYDVGENKFGKEFRESVKNQYSDN